MWVDGRGVVHTVALPEPADVLTARALGSFRYLRDTEGAERIQEILEAEQDAILDPHHEPDVDNSFVGEAPPVALLDGDLDSLNALIETVRGVPDRWRLDVLLALEDLNDEDDQ